ncbi:UNVERIFIED_CONTAM: hypothetical protein GTU68_035936 [Idotea baltica]|nr:hypothetical protein [Idotea baltica]
MRKWVLSKQYVVQRVLA